MTKIADIPDELRDLIDSPMPARANDSLDPGTADAEHTWQGVEEGQRNNTAARYAGTLIAQGFNSAEVRRELAALNSENQPPMSDDEVAKTVRSIDQRDRDNHPERHDGVTYSHHSHPLSGGEDEKVDSETTEDNDEPDLSEFPVTSATDLLAEDDGDAVQPHWDLDLFPRSLSLWSGEAKLGKSTIAYNLAVAGATGGDFVGIPFPPGSLRVLYLDMETPHGEQIAKLRRVLGEHRDPGALWYLNPGERLMPKSLEQLIRAGHFDLVFVDTLSVAFPVKSEDDNAEATRQLAPLKRMTMATGACVVLLHHIGKAREKGSGVYLSRGASARACIVDTVVNITEPHRGSGVLKLEVAGSRLGGTGEALLIRKVGDDRFERVEDGASAEQRPDTKTTRASALIGEALHQAGASGLQRKDAINTATSGGITEPTAQRALEALVADGTAVKIEHGRYVHAEHVSEATSDHSHPLGGCEDEKAPDEDKKPDGNVE